MGAPRDDLFSVYPEQLVIGAGLTCFITPMNGQNAGSLKKFSGGTLLILGASASGGCTFSVANQYLVGSSEIVNLNLSGGITLFALGATVTCFLLRGRSEGFNNL